MNTFTITFQLSAEAAKAAAIRAGAIGSDNDLARIAEEIRCDSLIKIRVHEGVEAEGVLESQQAGGYQVLSISISIR